MDKHDNRRARASLRQDKAADELRAVTLEDHFLHVEIDAVPARSVEADVTRRAVGKRNGSAVRPLGPAENARPRSVGILVQCAGFAAERAPAQRVGVGRRDVDYSPVRQAIGADVTIVRNVGLRRRRGQQCDNRGDKSDRDIHSLALNDCELVG